MTDFKSLCILGRQPAIGLAELESLYGSGHVRPAAGHALLDIPAEDINFKRLGGTVKVGHVLTVLPTTKWPELLQYLKAKIPEHLQYLPPGKFTLGLSVYNLKLDVKQLNRDLLSLKKVIRTAGKPARIVPNQTLDLSSAQVLHNQLTHRGAWELIFLSDGQQTYLAQTFFVQDIDAYAARDQARPKRDARVGMLPPKLAQIILNLAKPTSGSTILDPFCGTGVVLQEALLMGYQAIGADIEPRMIEFSQTNLEWLQREFKISNLKFKIIVADATEST